MKIFIRPVASSDYESWSKLYSGYADFYQIDQTQEMRNRTWTWLLDADNDVNGLVATNENAQLVGLAHYRIFNRPLTATIGGFLDDLYVEPSIRKNGIGTALIEAVTQMGRERNWSVIRWITAETNHVAQTAYDKVAFKTKWVTYDIKL